MKIKLGAGSNWENKGWHILDHKINKNEKSKIKSNLNNTNLNVKVGSCRRCKYLKQRNLTFDCITPSSWYPKELNNE